MAKSAGPLFSERASGSFGGSLTFDTHRGMPIVRRRATTAQPRSAAQLAARARFAHLTRSWRDLTSTQRGHWDVWAANNEPNDPHANAHLRWSAANAYLALNAVLMMMGETIQSDPPVLPKPDPLEDFTAAYSAVVYPKILFNWHFTLAYNEYALINSATHLKVHTLPDKSDYRFIKQIALPSITKEWAYPPRGQLHFQVPVADKRNGLRSQIEYATCWSDG